MASGESWRDADCGYWNAHREHHAACCQIGRWAAAAAETRRAEVTVELRIGGRATGLYIDGRRVKLARS